MANFTPSKKTAQDFNNGIKYVDGIGDIEGDAVHAGTINNVIESQLYVQEQAENTATTANKAVDTANSALDKINVAINSTVSVNGTYPNMTVGMAKTAINYDPLGEIGLALNSKMNAKPTTTTLALTSLVYDTGFFTRNIANGYESGISVRESNGRGVALYYNFSTNKWYYTARSNDDSQTVLANNVPLMIGATTRVSTAVSNWTTGFYTKGAPNYEAGLAVGEAGSDRLAIYWNYATASLELTVTASGATETITQTTVYGTNNVKSGNVSVNGSTVTVNHGVGATPSKVLCFLHNPSNKGTNYYTTAINSTSFTVSFYSSNSASAQSITGTLYWMAIKTL